MSLRKESIYKDGLEIIEMQPPSQDFFFLDYTSENSLSSSKLAQRGVVSVTAACFLEISNASLVLSTQRPSKHRYEFPYAKQEGERLFFSFNSKDLEDGYYLLTINCIAKSGEFKSSYPIDLLIDNTPPNEVQISGLVTEDGREKIGDSEYRIVRAEIIAKDQIGIDRIELYELAQNEADTPLAVTAEIESSQKIIQFCMDFSIKKLYQIYARAFDLSGNYRDSELKELKATR